MEKTMPCSKIAQQSRRKPLDACCFEGDSTKAGPKSPVQLYERGPFAKPFARVSTINDAISVTYGEWCNGSTTDSDSVCLGSNPGSPATHK